MSYTSLLIPRPDLRAGQAGHSPKDYNEVFLVFRKKQEKKKKKCIGEKKKRKTFSPVLATSSFSRLTLCLSAKTQTIVLLLLLPRLLLQSSLPIMPFPKWNNKFLPNPPWNLSFPNNFLPKSLENLKYIVPQLYSSSYHEKNKFEYNSSLLPPLYLTIHQWRH